MPDASVILRGGPEDGRIARLRALPSDHELCYQQIGERTACHRLTEPIEYEGPHVVLRYDASVNH
jgi:hypothetical protein